MRLFKQMSVFQTDKRELKVGDFIYFSWEENGFPTQVGIVEYTDNEFVRVIMGNASIFENSGVVEKLYKINSIYIIGYARPQY